jgi:cardiolipin synthase A/B
MPLSWPDLASTLWALVPTSATFWVAFGLVWFVAALAQAAYVIMQRRSPVATLGWIFALTFVPVLGLIAYRFLGPKRVERQRLKRLRGLAALGTQRERLKFDDDGSHRPKWAVQHSRLIERACGIPLSSASHMKVFRNGEATFAAMLEAIENAKEHIHLEYYIFEPDEIGNQILDALVRKAASGVKVRLLIDALGSPDLAKKRGAALRKPLWDAGGEVAVFHPARFARFNPLVNLRTHRKILICDGVVGFTGGINITATEHEGLRKEYFRDTHMRMDGPVVRWLQYVFLEDWAYAKGGGERLKLSGDLIATSPPGSIEAQIVASGPDSGGEAIHRAMISTLHSARERVWLTTPYFVPTEAALYALMDAAMRGVDVKILVPKRGDSGLVTAAAQTYFDELIDAGVKIFEYLPRMLHAKTMVADDEYAMVGTSNFDHRSFRLNFEVGVVTFDKAINHELAEHFERDLSESRLVSRKDRLQIPFGKRLFQSLARLMSPVL